MSGIIIDTDSISNYFDHSYDNDFLDIFIKKDINNPCNTILLNGCKMELYYDSIAFIGEDIVIFHHYINNGRKAPHMMRVYNSTGLKISVVEMDEIPMVSIETIQESKEGEI